MQKATVYDPLMPTGPFGQAVDAAIAKANEAFLNDPIAIADAQEEGRRALAMYNAREALGEHGVVLPTALAADIAKALRGEPTMLDADLMARMVEGQIPEARA
jgi:hypothetical protein